MDDPTHCSPIRPLALAPPATALPSASPQPHLALRLSIFDDVAAEQPPAGAGQPAVYRHAATGEQSVYHPFRAAFTALCKQAARWTWEPRRADAKAPEAWMEMADGSGGLFYYCFVTKARRQSDAAPRPCTRCAYTLCLRYGCTHRGARTRRRP